MVKVKSALYWPPLVGLNVTLSSHDPMPVTWPVHPSERLKLPGFAPARLEMTTFKPLNSWLVKVTVCTALVVPMGTSPKLTAAGNMLSLSVMLKGHIFAINASLVPFRVF